MMGIWLRHDDCQESISHLLNSAVAPVQPLNQKEVLTWNYKYVLKFEKSDPESFKQ